MRKAEPTADPAAQFAGAKAELRAALLGGRDTSAIRVSIAALEARIGQIETERAREERDLLQAAELGIAATAAAVSSESISRVTALLAHIQVPEPPADLNRWLNAVGS